MIRGIIKQKKSKQKDGPSSAEVAYNRLKMTIESDRLRSKDYPFLEEMKNEIIEVIKKYVDVKEFNIKKEVKGDVDALSIDVAFGSDENINITHEQKN